MKADIPEKLVSSVDCKQGAVRAVRFNGMEKNRFFVFILETFGFHNSEFIIFHVIIIIIFMSQRF